MNIAFAVRKYKRNTKLKKIIGGTEGKVHAQNENKKKNQIIVLLTELDSRITYEIRKIEMKRTKKCHGTITTFLMNHNF